MIWKETKRYWKPTEAAALDGAYRVLCRTCFEIRYGPEVKTGYMTMIQIYWYKPNQSRYRYHHAESCTIYVFRVFDKYSLYRRFSPDVYCIFCVIFLWWMVSDKLRKSVSDYENARSSVSPNILRTGSWPTIPVYRIRCFDSEQVGESELWTLRLDSAMGRTRITYVREV